VLTTNLGNLRTSSMASLSAIRLLSNRLDFVDVIIFGKPNDDPDKLQLLKDRLSAASLASVRFDNELPQIAMCRDLMLKMKPLLSKSKSSLSLTLERLETIFALRAELEGTIDGLVAVEKTAKSANISACVEIAQFQEDLLRIDGILTPLIALSNKQSDEIDAFLSTYENAV
jgi:hypothetical protein